MEEIFDKVKDGATKVKDGAQKYTMVAVSKTKNLIDKTKYNYTISDLSNKKRDILSELGKVLYEEFENGSEFDDDINEKCERIATIEKEITELKKKVSELKNEVVCENCRRSVAKDSDFCPKCGTRL